MRPEEEHLFVQVYDGPEMTRWVAALTEDPCMAALLEPIVAQEEVTLMFRDNCLQYISICS